MLISRSSNMSAEESAFCAFCAIACFAYLEETPPSNVQAHLKKLSPRILKFASDNDLSVKYLLNHLVKGSDFETNQKAADSCYAFAQALRDSKKTLYSNKNITAEGLKILNDTGTAIVRVSEPAYNRVVKNSDTLGDNIISQLFAEDDFDNNEHQLEADLKKLIKAETGKAETGLNAEVLKELREKDPDFVKQYNKMRRELLAVGKNFIQNYVRNAKDVLVPASELRQALASAKIKYAEIPEGFKGKLDAQGNYYTSSGKKLLVRLTGKVKMNAEYDEKSDNGYVCLHMPTYGKQQWLRIYTEDYRSNKTQEKFNVAKKFSKDFDSYRKKWLNIYNKYRIDSRDGIVCLMLELAYQTSARIGTPGNKTEGKDTYGLSTMLCKHLRISGTTATFAYGGKHGQDQKHRIKASTKITKMLVDDLKVLKAEGGSNDSLFVWQGKPIRSNMVNAMLRQLGVPPKITVHKFRTVRGTQLAEKILESSPLFRKKNLTQKLVMDWLKKSLSVVGKELGHFSNGETTVTTAINNYIDPSILDDFFAKTGVRPPATLQKTIDRAKGGN